jgi:3-carboxy-cis,cis-muconate cycloisomerase
MYDLFLRHPFMGQAGIAACDARALVKAMCEFEIGLARVEERAGQLPAGSASAIENRVRPEAFDIQALAEQASDGGNVAIPFVKQAKALLPDDLKARFHRGATSQDVIDSTLMLVLKPCLARCLEQIDAAISGGAELMDNHADTPVVGRTLSQQALPITFGAKAAGWLVGLAAAEKRLKAVYAYGLFVQFGGAVGAHHGVEDGLDVMAALADELGLSCPVLPWHTDRQPLLAIIDAVDVVAVAAEKIATDVALMAQTEVGEVREPPATGAGGSSSMPHKANPVGCVRIRAAACQIHGALATLHNAGAQAHERAFGEWHAEWAPLVDAILLLEGALDTLALLVSELQVDAGNMRANLALTGGANLAAPTIALLGEVMETDRAGNLAAEAAEDARHRRVDYAEALFAIPEIAQAFDAERVRAAVDPGAYTGTSKAQIARVRRLLSER